MWDDGCVNNHKRYACGCLSLGLAGIMLSSYWLLNGITAVMIQYNGGTDDHYYMRTIPGLIQSAIAAVTLVGIMRRNVSCLAIAKGFIWPCVFLCVADIIIFWFQLYQDPLVDPQAALTWGLLVTCMGILIIAVLLWILGVLGSIINCIVSGRDYWQVLPPRTVIIPMRTPQGTEMADIIEDF